MCLKTKQSTWLTADKDITCFKLLEPYWDHIRRKIAYRTPYRRTIICDNVINGKEDFHAEGNASFFPEFWYHNMPLYRIEEGAIHAYQTLKKAEFEAGLWGHVFRCMIPTGTKYAVGESGDICAVKIRFIENKYNSYAFRS